MEGNTRSKKIGKRSKRTSTKNTPPTALCAAAKPDTLRSLGGMFEFQSLALLDVVNNRLENRNARVVCNGISNLINLAALQLRYGKQAINKALSVGGQ